MGVIIENEADAVCAERGRGGELHMGGVSCGRNLMVGQVLRVERK